MNQIEDYEKEFNSILDSVRFIRQVDDNRQINKAYVDLYTTKEQQMRDRRITELLNLYVDGYQYKIKSNKWYKGILIFICIAILITFCTFFILFLWKFNFNQKETAIPDMIQLISVCVTFLGLIIGLLQIITKYVFPEKEEEYITRIVELIQQNDLENKKENIKVHESEDAEKKT